MGRALSERFIQDAVAEGLNRQHYRRRSAYVATEAYTKLRRADVFLAFMRTRGRPYVVVVEAKSRTTIHQLKLRSDARRARRLGRYASLVLVGSILTVVGYQWYLSAVSTFLAGALFLTASAGATWLVRRLDLRWTKQIAAIRQLARYPANEKWIAVGEDTFARASDLNSLRRQCRKGGIGLIIVDGRGRLRLDLIPEPRHSFNDYLSRYGKREEIMDAIRRRPAYGSTPAERRRNRDRFGRIALLSLFMGLLLLFGYERERGHAVPDPPGGTVGSRPDATIRGNEPDFGPWSAAPSSSCDGGILQEAFVVVDTILPRGAVEDRLTELLAIGLGGMEVFALGCFDRSATANRRVIATRGRYTTHAEAERAARTYERLLESLGQADPRARTMRFLHRTDD